MSSDADRYEAFYAAKLWELLPAVYRAADADYGAKLWELLPPADRDSRDPTGPLEEIVNRIGAQAAIVRRSIDRSWQDQSIETCDDWVIAYMAELLATNLVSSLDARGRRLDVFKTIHYRRRKGTAPLLEELASDVTGWSARVVEFFQRLGRTRHALDPAIGLAASAEKAAGQLQRAARLLGARTRTGAGGFADLRNVLGAELCSTAFDEFAHSVDVRRGRGRTGWYDIPRLGVFVWRLRSFGVRQVTPVADLAFAARKCQEYTFDPTGRDVALFARGERAFGDQWVPPEPEEVPGPIPKALLQGAIAGQSSRSATLYPSSVALYRPWVPEYQQVPASDLSSDPRAPNGKPWIDPVRGRIVCPKRPAEQADVDPFRVDYHYGFSAEIGAGPYERPWVAEDVEPLKPCQDPKASLVVPTTGTLAFGNSLTYTTLAAPSPIERCLIRAQDLERPLLRLARALTFSGGGSDAVLVLDGLFISGGMELVLDGQFDRVVLSCCTLDPGTWDANKGAWAVAADTVELGPTRLRVSGSVRELVIQRCICGPILVDAAAVGIESLRIEESIVQAAEPGALALHLPGGELGISRSTLLGQASVHRIDVSECILHHVVEVADVQHGCVRFSAYAEPGSRLPRKYESVPIALERGLFASRAFGDPAYAQLLASAGAAIAEGAEDGSEMGAFWRERNAIKERSLLIKYQEYLPLGLEPVVIHAT